MMLIRDLVLIALALSVVVLALWAYDVTHGGYTGALNTTDVPKSDCSVSRCGSSCAAGRLL